MRAAVVRELGKAPDLGVFPDPVPAANETVVRGTAVAINPLTLSRAGGAHYSARTAPPFVAGVDGVGRTEDGRPVYVARTRAPFGTLAERVPVSPAALLPLPGTVSDALAAAIAIPGLSSWNPLSHRARIRRGEAVIVHGATGAAGRLAIQIAKHFGARSVVAMARNRTQLEELAAIGADRMISIDRPAEEIQAAVREATRELQVGVVLDYLWGPTAVPLIAGVGGPEAPRGPSVVRYVQIGAIAGSPIPLESAVLRSSGVEILGSGLGSSTEAEMRESLAELFAATAAGHLRLDTEVHSWEEVPTLWGRTGASQRLVFTIPGPS